MKKSKLFIRFISLIIIFLLIYTLSIPVFANEPFNLSAKSAILIDSSNGKII